MHKRHLHPASFALAAALTSLPALADTTLPGTLCTSDGPVEKSLTGLMTNKATAPNETTFFHCPIIRTQPVSNYGGTLAVTINVKTNSSTAFECVMRSMLPNNVTYSQSTAVFASGGTYGSYDTTTNFMISLPAQMPASVNMRCSVPNISGNVPAGIVSYRIQQ